SVGIGLFILFIGLVEAGLVHSNPPGQGTPLEMSRLAGWPLAIAVIGLLFTILLMARNVRGALLWGIIATTVLAIVVNYASGGNLWLVNGQDQGIAKLPTQIAATPDFSALGHFSFKYFSKLGVLTAILIVFAIMLSDFFDTVGTLIGVGSEAGYLDENGDLPDAQKPLLVDSIAAIAGGVFGTSSATTYIESAAGVGNGGRTGLTSVVVGILFLLATPFWPLVGVVPAQATAPALILVGFMMTGVLAAREQVNERGEVVRVGGVDFSNLAIGLPVLATMILMPLTYNITNGIGAGFILYTLIRLARGEWRQIHPALYVVSAAFLIYFLRYPLFGVQV
ncbi:MAG: NCS2 family permease, partial [Thermomicrobiales bacterium]